jgi:hypothetical protein
LTRARGTAGIEDLDVVSALIPLLEKQPFRRVRQARCAARSRTPWDGRKRE